MFHNIAHLARNKIRNIIAGYLRKVYGIIYIQGPVLMAYILTTNPSSDPKADSVPVLDPTHFLT